jgi:HAD superfamily hydrolase (TIGR01509 family)
VTRGLLLDLDGTLADTLPMLRGVYARFLSDLGKHGDDAGFEEINGPPLHQVVAILKQRHALEAKAEQLLTRYMDLVQASYLDAAPSAGAAELLAAATQSGWTCAIVTSNSEALTQQWLVQHNLAGFIREVIGKESIRVGKPNPEPYVAALARLRCEPDAAIAVEDSAAGVAAATAALIPTFAYAPNDDKPGRFPAGVKVVSSLFELIPRLNEVRRDA